MLISQIAYLRMIDSIVDSLAFQQSLSLSIEDDGKNFKLSYRSEVDGLPQIVKVLGDFLNRVTYGRTQ